MSTPPELTSDFEITVAGDERGRQLAAAQAESVLEILECSVAPQKRRLDPAWN